MRQKNRDHWNYMYHGWVSIIVRRTACMAFCQFFEVSLHTFLYHLHLFLSGYNHALWCAIVAFHLYCSADELTGSDPSEGRELDHMGEGKCPEFGCKLRRAHTKSYIKKTDIIYFYIVPCNSPFCLLSCLAQPPCSCTMRTFTPEHAFTWMSYTWVMIWQMSEPNLSQVMKLWEDL